jgi:hypothetical protein
MYANLMEFETMETSEKKTESFWRQFIRSHWKMGVGITAGIATVVVVGVWVFLWYIAVAQAAGFIPATLGQWTIGYVLAFCLNVLFWELVFVVSWVLPLGALVYFQWFKKLPAEEQKMFDSDSKRGKSAGEGGGLSFFVTVTWLFIMWFAGRWDLAFQSWTLNDWVYTWLQAALWDLLIIAVPVSIGLIWWLSKDSKSQP